LRIESGSPLIDLRARRNACNEALRERVDAFLEPSGRALVLRASHSRSFGSARLRAAAGRMERRTDIRARDGEPAGWAGGGAHPDRWG